MWGIGYAYTSVYDRSDQESSIRKFDFLATTLRVVA